MENQNTQPNIENPSQNIDSIPPQSTPPKKKSKLIYLFVALIVLLVLTISASIGVNLYKASRAKITPTPSLTLRASPTPTSTIDTSTWKTYTNSKYGFSLMYPSLLKVTSFPSNKLATFSFQYVKFDGVNTLCYNYHVDPETLNSSEDVKQWISQKPNKSTAPILPYTNSLDKNITGYSQEGGGTVPTFNTVYIKYGKSIFSFEISGCGEGESYRQYPKSEEIIEKMISTFKFDSNIPTPTCMPRPACLDATPRCMIAEPANGWCASQQTCNSDADCNSGSTCMNAGPVIANQPNHKICVQKGSAVPL